MELKGLADKFTEQLAIIFTVGSSERGGKKAVEQPKGVPPLAIIALGGTVDSSVPGEGCPALPGEGGMPFP